jgi:hypothetical protein
MKAGTEGEQRYDSTLSLTSALDVGGWLTPRPGRFTPAIDPVTLCIGDRVGRPRVRSENSSLPPGFDFRTVQPASNR